MIEVFKNEESGHGDILSREFVAWRGGQRTDGAEDVEVARARLLNSVIDERSCRP